LIVKKSEIWEKTLVSFHGNSSCVEIAVCLRREARV